MQILTEKRPLFSLKTDPPLAEQYTDYLRVIASSSQLPKETYISEGHLSGIAIQGDGDHTSVDVHFGMASLAIIQRKGRMEMTDAAGLSLEQVVHP